MPGLTDSLAAAGIDFAVQRRLPAQAPIPVQMRRSLAPRSLERRAEAPCLERPRRNGVGMGMAARQAVETVLRLATSTAPHSRHLRDVLPAGIDEHVPRLAFRHPLERR